MIIGRDRMGYVPPVAPIPGTFRVAAPSQASNPPPTATPRSTASSITNQVLAHVYPLNPIQQREAMQRELWEKERKTLLKKASNSQGESAERSIANYLAV